MPNNISLEEIQNIQGSLCDMVSAYDLENKLKGNTGFVLKTVVCDAVGNTLFSYDTVMKYYEDENGTGKISAETAGKIIENIVFDAGLKKTVQLTLAASTSALFDSEPLTAGVVAVGTFTTGYSLTKAASVTAGELTKTLLNQYISDRNSKVIARENDETILEQDPETNITKVIADERTQINLLPYIKTDKVQIDDIVYIKQDLTNQTSLQIRNLLTDINSVNILLSNVLIKTDEKLDLGEKGIYTVKSGDTFSQIANNNGLTTKELLESNTWLIDDNRITFNTPSEILVNQTANLNNNNQNHTLIGTNSDDILIDHNGGDDLFEAGTGINYIDGGTGSDTISYKNITNSNKEGINVNLSLATAQIINSTTTDSLVNIENVIGSKYADYITGKDNSTTTLIGSDVNNTFISNEGNDTLKDTAGGNDIYKFKKGDGVDTIYDIKGNDTIIFDESVLKSDITFSQSDDLKSLIINYSPTDSITITNYFDSFSKIENIQLSTGEKLIPEFNTQTIGKNQAENLVTGYGNDTVTLNGGDDTIKDLSGNDTYTFKVGDGNDTIEDLDGIDKIVFENLSNDDLIFTQKDNNLIIHYSINDSVTILNYFDNTTSNYLEKIAFKNDLETIDASNIITGTVNDDEINGTYFDDVITSNKGNDTLKGFYGNDTYKFSKGDGNNRIYDVKGDDTIAFDESVKKEDISFIIKDNNLLINYSATDTIEVLNYFDNTNKIENIKLFNGEIVQITNIDKTLTGSQQNDTLIGSYGDDILIGNDGDDSLSGNVGKDKLYGGIGFDTYVANDGDIISDSDNLGKIIFEGQTLQNAIYDENKKVYVSSIGEYSLEDTTLTFTNNAGKKLIIENFDKNSYSLGINLTNEGRTFSNQTLYSNALVIDLNKDGFVNTNSLSNSNTYFDITNTNSKNKTQWLDNSDGFLVYDKNSDGIINSSDELFGNLSKSGFKELEELIDLNYDNKIDRKDSMFYQLKVWQDLNSDGIVNPILDSSKFQKIISIMF